MRAGVGPAPHSYLTREKNHMERYFDEAIETASREEILEIQNKGLRDVVKRVWDNVPYYRKKMEEKGVTPDDIKGREDLYKLPFLTKDDLREAYRYPSLR